MSVSETTIQGPNSLGVNERGTIHAVRLQADGTCTRRLEEYRGLQAHRAC